MLLLLLTGIENPWDVRRALRNQGLEYLEGPSGAWFSEISRFIRDFGIGKISETVVHGLSLLPKLEKYPSSEIDRAITMESRRS